MFIKTLIFQYINLKYYIQIETNISKYVIRNVLNQLNLDHLTFDLDFQKFDFYQWHPIAYFSRKMASIKTWYKIHDISS